MTKVDAVAPKRRMSRTGRVVILLLSIAVVYLLGSKVMTQLDANTASEEATAAQQEAKSVADPLDEVCRRDEEIRRRLGDLCDTAAEVKDQPAPPEAGRDGRDGEDGRGIASTAIVDGRLLITYTDGVLEDKGPIVTQGTPGRDGRSIVGTAIQNGALVLSYSDGTTETVGQVVGENGHDGADGRGVASVAVSADFRLLVTYTDGETVDVGPLPPGPAGRDGRGIASIAFDMDTCTATVTYTDGTAESTPMTGCQSDEPPPPEPGPLLPGG
jgi:hypothetical protein